MQTIQEIKEKVEAINLVEKLGGLSVSKDYLIFLERFIGIEMFQGIDKEVVERTVKDLKQAIYILEK